jgi:ferritin
MNKNVESILVSQIEKEGYSSNLYLAMASWAETQGLEGTAQWLYAQADEEKLHMLKIIKYVNERGGHGIIPAFKMPGKDFTNVKSMFEMVLKHEEFITDSINNIVGICNKEKDFTTHNWIQWFVMEQIQEEKSARAIIDKLKLLGDNNMYIFDKDVLAMRGTAAAANAQP